MKKFLKNFLGERGRGGGYGTRMSVKSNDRGGGLWYKNVSEK